MTAFINCIQIGQGVLSGHNITQQSLCSQDFMNFVNPIGDRKKIAQIKNQLRKQGRFRDLLLFTMGINSALHISDLLQLRIGHFLDDQGGYKQRFRIHEQNGTNDTKQRSTKESEKHLKNISQLPLALPITLRTASPSTPG